MIFLFGCVLDLFSSFCCFRHVFLVLVFSEEVQQECRFLGFSIVCQRHNKRVVLVNQFVFVSDVPLSFQRRCHTCKVDA